MSKWILNTLVVCFALMSLAGCYGEEPYADKKKAQEEEAAK